MGFVSDMDGRIAKEEAEMEALLRDGREEQAKARLKRRQGQKPRISEIKEDFERQGEDWRPQHRNLENEARRQEEYEQAKRNKLFQSDDPMADAHDEYDQNPEGRFDGEGGLGGLLGRFSR